MTQSTVHLAVCPHDCPDTCSMRVTVEGDRAVGLAGDADHPFTRGFLCHKVSRYLERVYHPGRLAHPLRRIGRKGAGEFERISWDEALDEIAHRFREIADGPAGPQAILPYSYCGTMGKIQSQSLDRRFFHRLGASKLDRTICATAGGAGYTYTIGARTGMAPEAFAESRLIINWGSNTAVTNSHLWVLMREAQKRGAMIVTIDPYRCRTAERSDWHIAPRVGTDAALALGLMHVIFRDGLEDRDYLERYSVGAGALRERVLSEYGVERVSTITGVEAGEIERLARQLAGTRASAIRINYGLQRHRGGGMAVRTIACLPAVTGAWREYAGGVLLSTSSMFPLNHQTLERPDLSSPGTRTVNMTQLAEALHGELPGPPVRALYVYNSNPAAVAPDQKRVLSGLARDDLFTVVHEQFATDTCDYADLVIPATTQLEHFDLHTAYGHHWIQVNHPCIAPLGEARSNTWVFRQLAARLGFDADVFQVSDEQLAREALWEGAEHVPEPLRGITLDRLSNEGPLRLNIAERYTPFVEGRFPTESGKCELYSERMAAEGFDPLPAYTPAAESPDGDPQLAGRFPLQLLSPPSPHFLNSTFVNVDSLRLSARRPELEIHPDDATPRGIRSGDSVTVFNERGSFVAVAVVGATVRPGVAVAPGVWWNKLAGDGANANATTSTRLTDMGGGATFFDNLVEIRRLFSPDSAAKTADSTQPIQQAPES
ncbi:MAG: molybdopterin oxidoreductase family protein [Planctomycetia bacterium]|nr:molybdopterin oxidoreductase family protein [Planctomycetia bacterium]